MTTTGIAAPLAAALAEKGYETLTPVQEAVLAADAAGRDLLVSAQTGSGKTVAFGLAIAGEVLDGKDILLPAASPVALVVAPTRELALQVRREFEWLFAGAGAILASCVGGMDYRTERRALERGAHVVVGTPGRLRDHIERGSLDLSAARAVVLDEADEMLDLGFAEDLGFILGAAAPGRRTLMFSATVPAGIEKLAAEFQRDALRLSVKGTGAQHADIAYRAISIAPRDKEHAIFNVLRFYEAERAIVFAKTRANVNHLFARMVNRGFQAVALSGELSQSERTHALQALRDGRARVCIATDVAARGIDLPGLELVIHADLPSNPETLLHRSGRTGRAGAKGTSVLIVPPAEFRKASRILRDAKVEAEWGKPPSADEVQDREDERLMTHPALSEAPGDEAGIAEALLDAHGADRVAAAFVRLWRSGRSAPEVLSDAVDTPPRTPAPPRDRAAFGPAVWYALSVGHEGRAEARWILPKICDAGGVAKDAIGAIRVQRDRTFVQIAEAQAGRFGAGLDLEPGLTMTRIEGEPAMDRPEHGERPARFDRAPRPEGSRPERAKPAYAPKPPRIVDDAPPPAPAADATAPRPASRGPAATRSQDDGRKPHAPRPQGEEHRPYTPRPQGDARKPYAPRPKGDDRKPYTPRAQSEDRKPYAPRAQSDDRKPYAPRPQGEDRRPYSPRAERPKGDAPRPARDSAAAGAEGGHKPRWKGGERPASPAGGAKPWGAKAGPAKTYSPRPRSDAPQGERPAGGGKPYAPRTGDKPGGFKSAGFKSHGGGDGKPARSAGYKSHTAAGGAPTGDRPPAKPRAPGFAKPAPRPPADPADTSRRFVPPKKPRG
ncbi:MAG: DEAD/DEAH box helicase [Paracoccaceae bacterium]|nr:MAG: DEAD/DEAH box helicase [Paracoccaceae bacterium]